MKNRFFDYNSTTPLSTDVQKVINIVNNHIYGNPSSLHKAGREAKKILEESREMIARTIGAEPEEIYFTSGGTESNNWALQGLSRLKQRGKNQIISARTEHSSVYETLRFLERDGWTVTWLPVNREGKIDPAVLEANIGETTGLITLMTANNETGVRQDMKAISAIASEKGVILHTDAVQAYGKIPLDVNNPSVDLMSLSAHKIYGPGGIGALYIRKGLSLSPLLHGGGQESGRRSGTENVAAIAGFAEAGRLAMGKLAEESTRLNELKRLLYSRLSERIQYIRLNGTLEDSLPNTLNLSFPGCESDSLVLDLDLAGFAVSAGSACSSAGKGKSRVLKAMHLRPDEVFSALRLSMGRDTTERDVLDLVEALADLVNQNR